MEKLVDIEGLAKSLLPISTWTIRKYVRERKIPFLKVEGRILFEPEAIEKWLAEHRVEEQPRSLPVEIRQEAGVLQ